LALIKKIKPTYLLFIFIFSYLIIGLFIAPDYGRSIDEAHEFRTARVALSFYNTDFDQDSAERYQVLNQDQYYGTASTGLIFAIQKFFFPNWNHSTYTVAHYSYFVFFLMAIIAIFYLGTHFFNQWVSLAVTLLFATQPLLFGHAFINPKDIPILATFLLTVILGFKLVDTWLQNEKQDKTGNHLPQTASPNPKNKQRFFLIILILIVLLLMGSKVIISVALDLVEYSYTTKETSILGKIFASQTTSGSLEGYLLLTNSFLWKVFRSISFSAPLLLVLMFYYSQRKRLFNQKFGLLFLLAAAVWGFAISTRVLAIAAGGMVGLYALIKLKRKALFPLSIYCLTASVVSYISWPFIWVFGLRGYLDSLSIFNDFPWSGQVLFEGQSYIPADLPANYLPKLMLLQFTEPLVILVLAGFVISLFRLFKRTTDIVKLPVLYAWFFIPLLYVILGKPTIYSNFRHLLFITPPLFIFAGFALEQITIRLKHNAIMLGISLLLIAPGVISIVQLHPYEYMYYNEFTGGVGGAYNNYELDYWSIAYKDAMDFVNENLAADSLIMVWKDNLSGKIYAKKPFIFKAHSEVPVDEYMNYDYMIIPADQRNSEVFFADLPIVFSVDVDGVSLVLVLKIQPGDN
jgi:hypothetical protein